MLGATASVDANIGVTAGAGGVTAALVIRWTGGAGAAYDRTTPSLTPGDGVANPSTVPAGAVGRTWCERLSMNSGWARVVRDCSKPWSIMVSDVVCTGRNGSTLRHSLRAGRSTSAPSPAASAPDAGSSAERRRNGHMAAA